MAKQRDFQTLTPKYRRRIERGLAAGKSRKASRGHTYTERPPIRTLKQTKRGRGHYRPPIQHEVKPRPQDDGRFRTADVLRAVEKARASAGGGENPLIRCAVCGTAVYEDAQGFLTAKKLKSPNMPQTELDERLAAEGLIEAKKCLSGAVEVYLDLKDVIEENGDGRYLNATDFANIVFPPSGGGIWVHIELFSFGPAKMHRSIER